jgi:hypothetical protein
MRVVDFCHNWANETRESGMINEGEKLTAKIAKWTKGTNELMFCFLLRDFVVNLPHLHTENI